MEIGEPKRVREVEPLTIPVPETIPVPVPGRSLSRFPSLPGRRNRRDRPPGPEPLDPSGLGRPDLRWRCERGEP
jgi:hypothetical protein